MMVLVIRCPILLEDIEYRQQEVAAFMYFAIITFSHNL